MMMPLGKWQALNLAILSFGIVLARSCTLSIVAERLWVLGKADTVERRVQRFLSNSRICVEECRICVEECRICVEECCICVEECCIAWSRWVFMHLQPCSAQIILLVDETKLADHLSIMVVALAYRKRAIPVVWRCYHQEKWPCSQVELVCGLLKLVGQALPPGVVPLVQADRGIGTSPELALSIQQMGWHYLFRVQGQCRFWEEGTDCKQTKGVKQLARRGGSYVGAGQVFKKAAKEKREGGWLQCRVLVKWPAQYDEPWCLITNSPNLTATHYVIRAWQEQGFRDLKSGGWQWQRSHVWKPEHAQRLVLAMSIAYAFLLMLGTAAIQQGKQTMRQLTRGHRHQFSAFRLGIRYLSHLLSLPKPTACPWLSLDLPLTPHYPQC
jgi:hypothetical protein